MPLKIFIPGWSTEFDKPHTIPPLYPFLRKDKTKEQLLKHYGNWIDEINIVSSIEACDIVVPLYEVGYYYRNNKLFELKQLNKDAINAKKLTICWSKDDIGITPPIRHFHLYRMGGYRSKNKGNEFLAPVFIKDPLPDFFNDELPVINEKTAKPIIGFCGQAKAGFTKLAIDILRGFKQHAEKLVGKNYFDLEQIGSSTYDRSRILDELEHSSLVTTNFIRHKKYRAGIQPKQSKEESTRQFFINMKNSQYIICYRGAGNFSVRLYETLASGRIPIIIHSDNNLPFEDEINWNMFPNVPGGQWKKTASIVSNFHSALSAEDFILLQQKARNIYEEYLSYNSFMRHWIKRYKAITTEAAKSVLVTQ